MKISKPTFLMCSLKFDWAGRFPLSTFILAPTNSVFVMPLPTGNEESVVIIATAAVTSAMYMALIKIQPNVSRSYVYGRWYLFESYDINWSDYKPFEKLLCSIFYVTRWTVFGLAWQRKQTLSFVDDAKLSTKNATWFALNTHSLQI